MILHFIVTVVFPLLTESVAHHIVVMQNRNPQREGEQAYSLFRQGTVANIWRQF